MASEIRVDRITHTAGVGTITPSPTGVHIAGIVTGTTFSGSGASLTSLPAAQVTGTLPAISGANLTNLAAANLTGTIADARFPATLPAASAANLTSIPAAQVTGTLPALTAANLTNIPAANIVGLATAGFERSGGFGITEVDEWRFNSSFDRQSTADVTANWERADTAFDKIGNGMSESSGIFTFPSAGIWAIDAQINTFSTVGLSSWIELSMSYSTNSGASFTDYIMQTYDHVEFGMGYYAYNTQTLHGVIDVLDASTWRVKFRLGAANNSIRFSGGTDNKTNNFRFIKLGDT